MAEHGHLRPDEIAAIAEEAGEAKTRIGTASERIGSNGFDRVGSARRAAVGGGSTGAGDE
jgi:hypothetical protein